MIISVFYAIIERLFLLGILNSSLHWQTLYLMFCFIHLLALLQLVVCENRDKQMLQ